MKNCKEVKNFKKLAKNDENLILKWRKIKKNG